MDRWWAVGIICLTMSVICGISAGVEHPDAKLSRPIQAALKEFPSTVSEVDASLATTLQEFDRGFQDLLSAPKDSATFANVVLKWHDLGQLLQSKLVLLHFLGWTTNDQEAIAQATQGMALLDQRWVAACEHEQALAMVLAFSERALQRPGGLSPDQAYVLDRIVASVPENNPLKAKARAIQQMLVPRSKLPYAYARGGANEATLPDNRKIAILSWNVCCFDHALSMLFGGVLPWQDRIGRIAAKIRECNPDVVCLQEVFSREAGSILRKELEGQYAHFYLDMGPYVTGFDPTTPFGISSGLFVASKYPLRNAEFVPYTSEQTPPNRAYGFFSAEIVSGDEPLAHLMTTHLQPGSDPSDLAYRTAQLKALARGAQLAQFPLFLCGDFNIERGGSEYKSLHAYEQSKYEGLLWTCCELRDYWWKARQDASLFQALPLEKEWIDYFVQRRQEAPVSMDTRVIEVSDLAHPGEALSDHQALWTTVTVPQKSPPYTVPD